MPVDRQAASGLGSCALDDTGRVVGFLEKPKTLKKSSWSMPIRPGSTPGASASRGRDCLASMGIYLFNRQTLVDLLTKTDYHDFGKEIFPTSMRTHKVQVYLFDGYWEDIGTIRSFYQANLDLAARNPPFELTSSLQPVYTQPRFLAPSRIEGATIKNSLVADGCDIREGVVIENSVIGVRCQIGRDSTIRNSVIMGADFYETPDALAADRTAGLPPIAIGEKSVIDGAIIDKNCRIGRNVRIANERGLDSTPETPQALVRDGIVVVPKGAVLADGWSLGEF